MLRLLGGQGRHGLAWGLVALVTVCGPPAMGQLAITDSAGGSQPVQLSFWRAAAYLQQQHARRSDGGAGRPAGEGRAPDLLDHLVR